MNPGRLLRAAAWPAFFLGLLTAGVLAFRLHEIFLIGRTGQSDTDFALNVVTLIVFALAYRFEPLLWACWLQADPAKLRRRFLLDLLPLLAIFLLRGVWSLPSASLIYLFVAVLGLYAISIWATKQASEQAPFWTVVPFLLVWALLFVLARRQPLYFVVAFASTLTGLLVLRRNLFLWLQTESIAASAALPPLLIALFPATSNWWLSTGAIVLGFGRLWAYPKWVRRPAYGWVMIFAVATAALLTEGALRVSPDAPAFESRHFANNVVTNDILFWVHKDVFRGDSDFGVMRVKIRGRDVTKAKTPGVQRVLCCGGSSTFGVNLPIEQSWPYLAERRLRGEGCAVELLNAGEPGYTIFQIKLLLEHFLLPDYQPDGVILYVGYNDSRLTRGPYSERDLWRMWQAARAGEGAWQTRFSQWMQRSRAYNLFAHLLVGARHRLSTTKKAIASPPEFSATLSETLKMLRDKNIRVLVAAEAYQEPDTIYRRIMQKQAAVFGASFVDVYDVMRKRYAAENVHTDVVHLTPEGNRDVAALIADAWRTVMQEDGLCRP